MQLAKIRVAIRIRPVLESEKKQGYKSTKLAANLDTQEIKYLSDDPKQGKIFKFDQIFNESCS